MFIFLITRESFLQISQTESDEYVIVSLKLIYLELLYDAFRRRCTMNRNVCVKTVFLMREWKETDGSEGRASRKCSRNRSRCCPE